MRLAMALLAVLLAAAAPAPDCGRVMLARLCRTIGTDAYDAVLYDPLVITRLHALLGGAEQRVLFLSLYRIRPIRLADGALILQGEGARRGDAAILAVRLADGAVEAAIRAGNSVTLFGAGIAPDIRSTARAWADALRVPIGSGGPNRVPGR